MLFWPRIQLVSIPNGDDLCDDPLPSVSLTGDDDLRPEDFVGEVVRSGGTVPADVGVRPDGLVMLAVRFDCVDTERNRLFPVIWSLWFEAILSPLRHGIGDSTVADMISNRALYQKNTIYVMTKTAKCDCEIQPTQQIPTGLQRVLSFLKVSKFSFQANLREHL